MYLPTLKENKQSRLVTSEFGGYDRRLRIGDGQWREMQNMTGDCYPMLASRAPRGIGEEIASPAGLTAQDTPVWGSGSKIVIGGEGGGGGGGGGGEELGGGGGGVWVWAGRGRRCSRRWGRADLEAGFQAVLAVRMVSSSTGWAGVSSCALGAAFSSALGARTGWGLGAWGFLTSGFFSSCLGAEGRATSRSSRKGSFMGLGLPPSWSTS